MQPITEKRLKSLIKDAKDNGKDITQLESALKKIKFLTTKKLSNLKEKKSGGYCYSSTGPSKKEDFE